MSVAGFFSSLFAQSWSVSGDDLASRSGSWGLGGRSMRTDTGLYVNERSAMNLPVAYACVGLLSDVLATAPAHVVVYDEKSGRTEPVTGDPRELMLNLRPNEYMTAFTQRQTTQAHTLLSGNGYCEIRRNRLGQGVELWPLPWDAVRPTVIGNPGDQRIRYQGTVAGTPIDLSPDEVLHIRGLGYDGLLGLSPIGLARQALGLGLAMEKFGAKLFANDLRSGGWLEHPGELSPQAMLNLRESIQAQGGLENAHGVKIIEEGMKFSSASIPPEDAQFLGSREFTIAEFARMYRVPLELLQAQGKTSSWGSGIEQLFLAFISFTLRPWVVQWNQEMSAKLLTTEEQKRGMRVVLSLDDMKKGDSTARAAFYERMHNIQALTVNEIRAEEGRNPLPGGNEFPEEQPAPMPPRTPERIREDDVERKDEAA